MKQLTINGEQRGLYRTEDGAMETLFDETDSSIDDVQLTPDRLTAMRGDGVAFSDLDHGEQVDWLRDEVRRHLPVSKIAKEHVAGEMEQRQREEYTPADAHILDGDHYQAEIDDWFDKHVNIKSFCVAPDVVSEVRTQTLDCVEDVIEALWDDLPHKLSNVSGIDGDLVDDLWDENYRTPLDLREATQEEIADTLAYQSTAVRIKADVGDSEC